MTLAQICLNKIFYCIFIGSVVVPYVSDELGLRCLNTCARSLMFILFCPKLFHAYLLATLFFLGVCYSGKQRYRMRFLPPL